MIGDAHLTALLRASPADLLDGATPIGAAVRADEHLREAAELFLDAQHMLTSHVNAQAPQRSVDVILKSKKRRKWHRGLVIAFLIGVLPIVGIIVALMAIAAREILRELLS